MAFPSPGSIHQRLKVAKDFFGVLCRNYNGAAAPSFRQARPPIRVYRKELVGESANGLAGQLFKDKEKWIVFALVKRYIVLCNMSTQ